MPREVIAVLETKTTYEEFVLNISLSWKRYIADMVLKWTPYKFCNNNYDNN